MNLLIWLKEMLIPTKPVKSEPEKAALAVFHSLHPDEDSCDSLLEVEEEDRYVVVILYGDYRPRRLQYFFVAKSTYSVTLVVDDSIYRPEIWR